MTPDQIADAIRSEFEKLNLPKCGVVVENAHSQNPRLLVYMNFDLYGEPQAVLDALTNGTDSRGIIPAVSEFLSNARTT